MEELLRHPIKRLEIPEHEILEHQYIDFDLKEFRAYITAAESWIRSKLEEAGFDMGREINFRIDELTFSYIYTQIEEED